MQITLCPDLHLGARIRSFGFEPNGIYKSENLLIDKLRFLIEVINEIQCDLIVFPGDIFDSPKPSLYSFIHAMNAFNQLQDAPTIFISGNHDTPHSPYDANPVKLLVNQLGGVKKYYDSYQLDVFHNCLFQMIGGLTTFPKTIDTDKKAQIIIGHFPISGPKEYQHVTTPEIEEQEKKLFLLGDCHNVFKNENNNQFYAGCLERTNFNEANNTPGFWTISYDEKYKRVSHEKFHPLPSIEFLTIAQSEFDPSLLDFISDSVVRFIGNDSDTAQAIKERAFGFVYQKEIKSKDQPTPIREAKTKTIIECWVDFCKKIKLPKEKKDEGIQLLTN